MTASDGALAGKVAIITGTGGGQGRAAALRFAAEGAKVVGCDLNEAGATETVKLVTDSGGEMTSVHPVNLSDEDAVRALVVTATEQFGGIDILYNNASAMRTGTALEMSREDFDFTLTNEITTTWLPTKHTVPVMAAGGGGAIVNVSSISGLLGAGFVGNVPGLFAHSATKGAVIRMTVHLAVELAPLGIRVNSISPGCIDTPATRPILGDDPDSEVRRATTEQLLIKRIGEGTDTAAAALFLASDEASYITGVNLPVDGGWAASGGVGQPDLQIAAAVERQMVGFQEGVGNLDN